MVDEWFVHQCRNPHARFFLQFVPASSHAYGKIEIAEVAAEGFLAASPTRIVPGWTKERAWSVVWAIVQKLPLYPG